VVATSTRGTVDGLAIVVFSVAGWRQGESSGVNSCILSVGSKTAQETLERLLKTPLSATGGIKG